MGKAIYKFDMDYGRMGTLDGVFVADSDEVKELIKSKTDIYFGEILGKHSEVHGVVEKKNFKLVTTNEEFIKLFEEYELSTGTNPFDYLEGNLDDMDFDDDDDEDY